jgi:His/Glu/Gln/Arg/opine family amino acid ABC transporter permease subunit
MSLDWTAMVRFLPRYGDAIVVTLYIFAAVSVIGTAIGLLAALIHTRRQRAFNLVVAAYSWMLRGVPELVVLLLCFMALPFAGLTLSPLSAAILAFTLVGIAYQFELFKAALAAVDRGQYEACRALGIARRDAMRRIILPQVLRLVVAPWITYATGALKRISVASAIAVAEIMTTTNRLVTATGKAFEFVLLAMLIYMTMTSVLMVIEAVMANRFNYLRDIRASSA